MARLSKQNKALLNTFAAAAAVVIAAVLCRRIVLTTGSKYIEQLANLVRIFLYLGLFAAWGASVQRRLVQHQVRRHLVIVAVLMILWLTVRELRWHMILNEDAKRLLWYVYYIPILMIPLLALLVSLSLEKPETYRLPKSAALLYIPTAILILLVLTNDLTGAVFHFPAGELRTEANYAYAPGYYAVTVWGVLCAAAAFAVMLTKCRLPRPGKFLWLPLIPFGAAVLYVILYAMRVDLVYNALGDLTAVECLLFTAFFECCIRCGLIQSNSRYSDLFRASADSSVLIADNGYTVRYASSGSEPISKDDMIRAEAAPVILPGGRCLHNMTIHGGHALWTEDISRLLDLRGELEGIQEELSDRNEIVRMEYISERERKTLEEQNRLYDLMQQKTQTQLDGIRQLASDYHKTGDEAEKRAILARIVVLGSFIKRRKDFVLSMEASSVIPVSTLTSAFQESFRSIELLDIRGACLVQTNDERMPGAVLALAYDFFEDVMEAVLDRARYINVRVAAANGALRCAVGTDAEADDAALRLKYPDMRSGGDGDGAEYILPLGLTAAGGESG